MTRTEELISNLDCDEFYGLHDAIRLRGARVVAEEWAPLIGETVRDVEADFAAFGGRQIAKAAPEDGLSVVVWGCGPATQRTIR